MEEMQIEKQIVKLKRNIIEDYAYSEAIKGLRTNIQYCGSNIHVIMFTSAMPDEGKSDISFTLALSMAKIGKKVVVVDADIRNSVLKDRYNVEGEILGLTHYLTGQKAADDVIYDTGRENLSVVFAGPFSQIPQSFWRTRCLTALSTSCGSVLIISLLTHPRRPPWPTVPSWPGAATVLSSSLRAVPSAIAWSSR